MAETFIQMFEEKFYPPIFLETAQDTIQKFLKQQEQITREWKVLLREYMEQIAVLQKTETEVLIAEMDISFLYTSLEENKAKFRIDSYGKGGRVWEESIATTYLPADWLVSEMDKMVKKLEECAAKESLRRYIRAAELETLKLRAVRSLLSYFALRFKYFIENMLDFQVLAKIQKAESFLLQIGEYMDWQNTIYAILPEVDIFNCDKNTELKFRNFPAITYQKKKFETINTSNAKFLDCTFEHVVMQDCIMNDCLFENCTFESVTIKNVQMLGSLFKHCVFKKAVFRDVIFFKEGMIENKLQYFEPAEFFSCLFSESRFEHCYLRECFAIDCQAQSLEIADSILAKSGFRKLKGVVFTKRG